VTAGPASLTGAGTSTLVEGSPASGVVLVLAHGAGADMHADFMGNVAGGLVARGHAVCRFNFSYADKGRRSPDRADVLEATFTRVVEAVKGHLQFDRLIIGGKSMGGRIASQIAASGTDVDGLVFLGYPLHPPGKPERLRVEHLSRVRAPMLFVEGTRDPFCPLATLYRVLEDVGAHTEVAVIDDGDHSFKVRKSSGRSTTDAWAEVVAATDDWIGRTSSVSA
jgi:predicted alpha/beta-hydrolase family hydrolase